MDQFVRDLLTADGSAMRNPAANYYRISRDPENSVETTAQLFLGVRIQCAKCHNHPFERWTQDDYYGFAAFFSRVKQKNGPLPDDEVIFAASAGRGPAAAHRQGDEAQGPRRARPSTTRRSADRRESLGVLADRPRATRSSPGAWSTASGIT